MTKEQLFLKLIEHLKSKHNLSLIIKKDNRRKGTSILLQDDGENILTYNTKDFITNLRVFHTAYHEIGHLVYKNDKVTTYNFVYAEYIAERWHLDNLSVDFPIVYKYQCIYGKNKLNRWKEIVGNKHINEPHFIAWKMIKEYN